jgi:hypothetical protein
MALVPMDDDRFLGVSLFVLLFVLGVTADWAFRRRPAPDLSFRRH